MTATPPHVVVVGDLATDVVARLRGPIAAGSDAAVSVMTTGGGSGANVAAWLRTTGTPVAFVGRIGDDASGRARVDEFQTLGVDVHVAVDERHPTGTVVVLVDGDGERTMLPDRGANLLLNPADIPARLFAAGRHLHLSGYALLDPGSRAAGRHALTLARGAGMSVSVDPSSAQPLVSLGRDHFVSWTRGADLCLPNLAEARVLTGLEGADDAAAHLAGDYGEVVVTLGADGAVWSDGHRHVRCPARPAAVRDTTGAGDAFTAGFLAGYVTGACVEEQLQRGTDLAAQAVEIDGARPPAP